MGTAGNVDRDGPGVLALATPELGPGAGTGTGLGTATASAGAGAAGPRAGAGAGAGAGAAGVGARGADTGATDAAEGAGLPEAGLAWLADVVDMSRGRGRGPWRAGGAATPLAATGPGTGPGARLTTGALCCCRGTGFGESQASHSSRAPWFTKVHMMQDHSGASSAGTLGSTIPTAATWDGDAGAGAGVGAARGTGAPPSAGVVELGVAELGLGLGGGTLVAST